MGYTHYWKAPHKFEFISNKKAMLAIDKVISHGLENNLINTEQDRMSSIDSDFICFNGVGDNSHETFFVKEGPTAFSFCKTNQKPYDKYVVACLIIFENFCQGFSWSSDGDEEDFQEAKELLDHLGVLNFLDENSH
jgi:hypothetical protein